MIDIVVTGVGAVTPLGNTAEASWAGALRSQSGIRPISHFDASQLRTRIAGAVVDFDATAYVAPRFARRVDRFVQLGVAAARMAACEADLAAADIERTRLAVVMGNTFAGVGQLEAGFKASANGDGTRLSPYFVLGTIGNMAAGVIAMALSARGPNLTVNQACASGTAAIGLGLRLLRSGEADVVVAGGCEASLTRLVFCGYHSLKATSTRNDAPERASRPFDMERDGFVPAEGAAAIVLEPRPAAERRGALILASLAGYGTSCDAYHPTRPDPSAEAPARCMRLALEDAGLAPGDIDCINAHGTSTRLNDLTEGLAITRVFGDRAARIPVTANKSLTGHAIGASGAIEAVFSVLGLRDQVVPPTANLEHPDPDCGLGCIPTRARTARLRAVLSNSFGFGGVNASLVFREATAGGRS